MKQFDKRIEQYKGLLKQYHKTLDLMSNKGLATLDAKIEDARLYSRQISSKKHKNKNILDIGSGGGLPGIIMAITLADWNISLVERRQRRASFLTIVKSKLNLENVKIFNADVRDLNIVPQAIISAQAVADFYSLYCLSKHLHSEKILLISRKGSERKDEIDILKTKIDEKLILHAAKKLSNGANLVSISLVGGKKCRQLE